MANWAYIENDTIIEVIDFLPQNWRNVSNLDVLENDLPALKNLGWYPIVHNNVNYDSNLHTLRSVGVSFNGNEVVETFVADEIPKEILYSNFLQELRKQRDNKLKESDFLCLYDLVNTRDSSYINDVANYRQQLRDLPEMYQNTNIVYNIAEVVWPKKPNLSDYPKVTNMLNTNGVGK